MSEANQKANQKASGTRRRGALGIRTTRAQELRNQMIQKNQEAKIPAKRPLTGNFCFHLFSGSTVRYPTKQLSEDFCM